MRRLLATLALAWPLAAHAQAVFTYSVREGHLAELARGKPSPGPKLPATANQPFELRITRGDLPLRYLTAFTPHQQPGAVQYIPAELIGGPAIQLCLQGPAGLAQAATRPPTLLIQQSGPPSGEPGCGAFERRRDLAPGQWLTIATESTNEAHDRQRGPYVVQIRISAP